MKELICGLLLLASSVALADEPPPAQKEPWTKTDNRPPEPSPSANLSLGLSAPPPHEVPRDKWGLPTLPGPIVGIPAFRLVMSTQLALRYNPLGLELFQRMGMQQRLYSSEKAFFRDNYFYFGLNPKFSPVYARVGPAIEVQPISMLNVRVTMEMVTFFPVLGYTMSYGSPSANYSDTARDLSEKQKLNYGPRGYHLMIEPTLALRAGPLVVRAKLGVEYWRMNLKNGDRVWYEPQLDTLLPANGWVLSQDYDLLYLTRFKFVAGLRYTLVMPLYDADDVAAGDSIAGLKKSNSVHRLGPLFAYTFFDKGLAKFNRPSLILLAQWHVGHRFRTGADVSAGVPLIALVFAFQSDFLK